MKNRASSKRSENEMSPQNERLQSFLRGEVDDIEKTLNRVKSPKADGLRAETKRAKESLESAGNGESAYLVLASLRRDIVAMKERAETLATKPGFLERIPPPLWLAIVPLLLVIYIIYLAIVQRVEQPQIISFATQTAAVQQQTMTPGVPETPAPASPTVRP